MRIEAKGVKDYISKIPVDRQEAFQKLNEEIEKNIPEGFELGMSYSMPAWVIPHSIYPDGYHCKPSEPVPFLSIASQKNFIAVYHMGLYADEHLMEWFVNEFPKHSSKKLDMGKSCIRFKKVEDIPYKLIGELASKMTADEWISTYESNFKK